MLFRKKLVKQSYRDKILELIKDSYIPQPKNYDFSRDAALSYLARCVSIINENYGQIVYILKSVFNFSRDDLYQWSDRINKFVSNNYDFIYKIHSYSIIDSYCTLEDQSKRIFNSYIQELNRFVNELANICSDAFLKTRRDPKENAVFIVHGHDEKLRNTLSKALLKNNYDPILLSEVNDTGITLWEKFEKYANKSTKAIILMTKDDFVKKEGEEYFQARPNVLIEYGYFLSLFDRKDIVVLFEKGCRMPSDINGVAYLEYSNCSKGFILKVIQSLGILA